MKGVGKGQLESTLGERRIARMIRGERAERIRSWRRRVLQRRGARMHAALGVDAENHSLAMLDEAGVVVAWYGQPSTGDVAAEHIVNRHVSQFYIPAEVASKQPLHDLYSAAVAGSHTREGWRRRADGRTFWGITVIHAVMLRDGRLQGFSYITAASDGPSVNVPIAQRVSFPQVEESERASVHRNALGFLPARDRMAASRRATRQRRLFRFASVGVAHGA